MGIQAALIPQDVVPLCSPVLPLLHVETYHSGAVSLLLPSAAMFLPVEGGPVGWNRDREIPRRAVKGRITNQELFLETLNRLLRQ